MTKLKIRKSWSLKKMKKKLNNKYTEKVKYPSQLVYFLQ
jgi:hypothetical protein